MKQSLRRLFLTTLLLGLASHILCKRITGQSAFPTSTRSAHKESGRLIAERLPRVSYHGGRFIRRPRLVTITFKHDEPNLVWRLEEFGSRITRTAWWREVTGGYCANGACIRDGRPGFNVRLNEELPAAIRDVDVEALLAREVKAGRFDKLDAETLLLVYLPTGVSLSDAFVPRYCGDGPRAYHRALSLDKLRIAYAVLPRCGDENDLTATASHEILEATTNPDPSARAFAFDRGPAYRAFTAAGVEPVDPCGLITMNQHRTMESGFVVQRAWSNRSAALGHDPCVPSLSSETYVALVPRQTTVRLTSKGESVTIAVDAAATGPTLKWTVAAVSLPETRTENDASMSRSTNLGLLPVKPQTSPSDFVNTTRMICAW